LRNVLHNQIGAFENLKVDWVPGHFPTAFLYGPTKELISQHEVGDKDLTEVIALLKEHGFVPTKKKIDMGAPLKTVTHGSSTYEVYQPGRVFADAKEFAESLKLNGVQGHLVTITSKEENDAIEELLKDTAIETVWLGAQDKDTEGSWAWISGPETSEVFWTDGTTKLFANWGVGEPNNANREDCAVFVKSGFWNDAQCEPATLSVIVEYSAPTVSEEEKKRSDL